MSSMAATGDQPEDDLVLLVGPDQTRLTANSMALRLASPVFNKMLGGNFKEANSKELELPDDLPEAFAILIQIAHHRIPRDGLQMPESLDVLYALAVLADKYMIEVVRVAIIQWFQGDLPTTVQSLWRYMEVAYILDDAKGFFTITNHLVLDFTVSFFDLPRLHDTVPLGMAAHLTARRAQLRAYLRNTLTELSAEVRILVEQTCTCDWYLEYHGRVQCYYALRNQDIRNNSVRSVMEAICNREEMEIEALNYCGVEHPEVDHRSAFENVRTKLSQESGLCMDCLTHPGGGSCRVMHLSLDE